MIIHNLLFSLIYKKRLKKEKKHIDLNDEKKRKKVHSFIDCFFFSQCQFLFKLLCLNRNKNPK